MTGKKLPTMSCFVFDKNTLTMAHYAAKNLCIRMSGMREQETLRIGCSGNPALAAIYQQFAKMILASHQQFIPKLHFFLIDERLMTQPTYVSLGDEAPISSRVLCRNLIDPLVSKGGMSMKQFHEFGYVGWADVESCRKGAWNYYQELRKLDPDLDGKFDIVILDGGVNGRCAGLLPAHESTENLKRSVFTVYAKTAVEPFNWMTATPGLLARTSFALLVISGSEQAEILRRFAEEESTPNELPCSVMRDVPHILATDIDSRTSTRLCISG